MSWPRVTETLLPADHPVSRSLHRLLEITMSQSKPCVHPVGDLIVAGDGTVRCTQCQAKVSGVSNVVKAMLPTGNTPDAPDADVRLLPPTATPDGITPEV